MTKEEKINTLKAIIQECEEYQWQRKETLFEIIKDLEKEPRPVNPQVTQCKDYKHFEYDSVANWDGIPLIVAHEICTKWGDGCKSSEDGYCFLFEPKEDEK